MGTEQKIKKNQTKGVAKIKLFVNDLFEQLEEVEWAMDKIKYPQSPLEEAHKKAQLEARAAQNPTAHQGHKDNNCSINYAN